MERGAESAALKLEQPPSHKSTPAGLCPDGVACWNRGALITGDIKTKIDSVWNAFWSGGISNPLDGIEQITYLLFLRGLDDLSALALLLDRRALVRGVRHLHAKLYLFGDRRAVVTSADLTLSALGRNHELGVVAEDPEVVERCHDYFEHLWKRAGKNLTRRRFTAWESTVRRGRAAGVGLRRYPGLTDEGTDAGILMKTC